MIMNFIPGLSLRSTEEDEIMGIDDAEIGEFAVSFYSLTTSIKCSSLTHLQYDYVEITRDVIGTSEGSVPSAKQSISSDAEHAIQETKA